MIEAAGLGVAMGSAPEGVRARANYVCGTAEEEGVREVIERFLLRGRLTSEPDWPAAARASRLPEPPPARRYGAPGWPGYFRISSTRFCPSARMGATGWFVVSTVWSAVTMARFTSMMFFTGSSACAYWSWSRAVIAWGYFPT